jgi:hypothetical protein
MFMKQKLLAGCAGLVLALGPSALGQDASWENWGQILVPSEAYPYAPQIDAYNFINHRGASIQISGTSLYDTSSTTNYVNEGIMTAFPGFDFRTYPNNMGTGRPAASFANLYSGPGTGEINCFGTLFYGGVPGLFFGNLSGNSKISVVAENITNSGNINLSAGSLLELKGKNINLTRGGLNMANTTSRILFGTNTVYNGINLLFNAGILDGYWGAETATNGISPAAYFGNNAITPLHWATTRDYLTLGTSLFGPVAYVNDSGAINSNRFVQAVFLYNFDPEFVNSVFFTPFQIVVQWRWTTPRWPDMSIVDTNYFFVTDNFGEVTNIGLRVNGYINPQSLYPTPTYIPVNYQFYQGAPYSTILTPATPGMLPGAFDAGLITNQYIAYQGIFTAGTALPTDIAGGAY